MTTAEMSDELDSLVNMIHHEAAHFTDLRNFQGFCWGVIRAGGRHLAPEERTRLRIEANRYLQEFEYPGSLFLV